MWERTGVYMNPFEEQRLAESAEESQPFSITEPPNRSMQKSRVQEEIDAIAREHGGSEHWRYAVDIETGELLLADPKGGE